MPLVRMVDRDEVPPETQATFDAGEQKYGKVLDAWRVIAHNPGIFKAYFPFLQAVFAPGALDQRTKQLSAVRVTILNHSRYALSHRLDAAKKDGLPEGDLIALGDLEGNRDRFSEAELAALDFTDELTTRADDVSFREEPLGVSKQTISRVQEHFGDAEIVELAMSVSMWNFLSRFLRVMDFELDMEPPPPELEAAI
jgi:alkylhydroperoxidase family enzyme